MKHFHLMEKKNSIKIVMVAFVKQVHFICQIQPPEMNISISPAVT